MNQLTNSRDDVVVFAINGYGLEHLKEKTSIQLQQLSCFIGSFCKNGYVLVHKDRISEPKLAEYIEFVAGMNALIKHLQAPTASANANSNEYTPEVRAFLEDLAEVCKKHELAIGSVCNLEALVVGPLVGDSIERLKLSRLDPQVKCGRFIVHEHFNGFSVEDSHTGQSHWMSDGVDCVHTGDSEDPFDCMPPGGELFCREWACQLNSCEQETLEAYFPETWSEEISHEL